MTKSTKLSKARALTCVDCGVTDYLVLDVFGGHKVPAQCDECWDCTSSVATYCSIYFDVESVKERVAIGWSMVVKS